MQEFWLVLLVQAIIFGGFSSFIAREKKRNATNWFILGFLFSLLAVLALIAIPPLDKITRLSEESQNIEFRLRPSTIWWIVIVLFGFFMILFQPRC